MGLIRKRGETIDFTLLQKRGLLKTPPVQQSSSLPSTLDGFVDLRAGSQTAANTASQFDFLSNLASSAQPTAPSLSQSDNAEVNALKIKIDDLEYKIGRLLERIAEMEARMR